MKIVSCIKQVYDLDIVLENDWVVDETQKSVDIHYANRIINSYDEASLELMLQLKDKDPSIMTKALTIGEKQTESILIKALAIGVDEVHRINVSMQSIKNPNDNATLIYESVKHDTSIDLILCGKQADINNYGQTGQLLAEKLNWPCFTNVFELEYINDLYHITRLLNDGVEEIVTKGPLVITSIPSLKKFLRMATLMNVMKAKRKDIKITNNAVRYIDSSKQYNFSKITIDKPIKHCEYIEEKFDVSIENQLKIIIDKYRGTGESK